MLEYDLDALSEPMSEDFKEPVLDKEDLNEPVLDKEEPKSTPEDFKEAVLFAKEPDPKRLEPTEPSPVVEKLVLVLLDVYDDPVSDES